MMKNAFLLIILLLAALALQCQTLNAIEAGISYQDGNGSPEMILCAPLSVFDNGNGFVVVCDKNKAVAIKKGTCIYFNGKHSIVSYKAVISPIIDMIDWFTPPDWFACQTSKTKRITISIDISE